MQLDRRRLFRAGFGLSAMAVPAAAQAQSRSARIPEQNPAATTPGIRPDTGRDETDRLQAAIDHAARQRTPLQLPAGRFIVRGLQLRDGTRIAGVGPATILQHLGGPSVLTADGVAAVSIRDLTIAGSFPLAQDRRGLIEITRTHHAEIENVVIETSPRNAILLERSSGRVCGCRITGAAKAGIFSLDSEGGMEISHNELSGIANNGILVWRTSKGEDGTIVAFNRISRIATADGGTGENGNAINVFRAGNVIVTSNRISDCAYSAVRANSASNVQILSNSISRMGEVAVFVEFAFDGAVVSGNLIDSATTGISVTNFDHGGRLAAVSGNVIRNIVQRPGEPATSGYGIAVEADVSVTGNTIENVQTAGLMIGWGRFCRDVAATGNVIRKSNIGISVTDDAAAGAVVLTGNMITGSTQGAIRRTNHGRPTSPDLALEPPFPAGGARGRLAISGNVSA
jgi:uncharacterized secreted repeat protein (TIGR03808 family)